MENKRYKILIDGRFIGVGESISRYTLEILKGILSLDKKNQYTLLVRPQGKKIAEQFHKSDFKNLDFEVLDIKHYSLSEQTKLLKWLKEKKFDLVHFTQFNHPIKYKGKFVATVHDLTLLGHLYRMNFVRRLGFRAVMSSVIKNSVAIITVSKTSKEDIIKTYKADEKKISVVNLAVDDKYASNLKPQTSKIWSFKKKYRIAGDYILYTGMWKKHKNLLRMLKAFEQVKKQDIRNNNQTNCKSKISNIQLVLVGKIDKDEPEVICEIDKINSAISNFQFSPLRQGSKGQAISNQFSNSKSEKSNVTMKQCNNEAIVTTGFIDEDELPLAYAGALAYCIPSLSEGFGLPPLEAMACGTPVISSNISAMPEILGNAPLYFDPYDVKDIAKAIKKIVSDKKLQKELSRKGLEQVKRYNWQNTAKRTLDVYRQVLKIASINF